MRDGCSSYWWWWWWCLVPHTVRGTEALRMQLTTTCWIALEASHEDASVAHRRECEMKIITENLYLPFSFKRFSLKILHTLLGMQAPERVYRLAVRLTWIGLVKNYFHFFSILFLTFSLHSVLSLFNFQYLITGFILFVLLECQVDNELEEKIRRIYIKLIVSSPSSFPVPFRLRRS